MTVVGWQHNQAFIKFVVLLMTRVRMMMMMMMMIVNPAGSWQGNPFTCAQSCAVFSSAVGGWSCLTNKDKGVHRVLGAEATG